MNVMSTVSLDALFLEHVGLSMAKHLALLRAIEGLPCHVDLRAGEVRFNSRFTFEAQLLGIEDQQARIWTWSWALPKATVAPELTRSAMALKTWGEEHGLDAFVVPSFKTESLRGDEIAILGCGLAQSDTFLVADTSLGSAYLLIPDVQGQLPTRHSAAFLATVIPKVFSIYSLQDHRTVVRSLLRYEGFELEEQDPSAWKAHRGSSSVTVTFDAQGRVAQFKAHDGQG